MKSSDILHRNQRLEAKLRNEKDKGGGQVWEGGGKSAATTLAPVNYAQVISSQSATAGTADTAPRSDGIPGLMLFGSPANDTPNLTHPTLHFIFSNTTPLGQEVMLAAGDEAYGTSAIDDGMQYKIPINSMGTGGGNMTRGGLAGLISPTGSLYNDGDGVALKDTIAVDYIGEKTGSHTVVFDSHITLANTKSLLCATAKGSDVGSGAIQFGTFYGSRFYLFDDASINCYMEVYSTAGYPQMFFRKARGTAAAPSQTKSGDQLGWMSWSGYTGGAWIAGAWIGAYTTEDYAAGKAGCYMDFWTAPTGGASRRVGYWDQDGELNCLYGLNIASGKNIVLTGWAAGDIAYYDGSKLVNLAKDAGKYLQSGASAVSWAAISDLVNLDIDGDAVTADIGLTAGTWETICTATNSGAHSGIAVAKFKTDSGPMSGRLHDGTSTLATADYGAADNSGFMVAQVGAGKTITLDLNDTGGSGKTALSSECWLIVVWQE